METLSLIPLSYLPDMPATEVTLALIAPSAAMLFCLGLTALAGAAGTPRSVPARTARHR
ncbi:MAG: hypothetical protein AAFT19_09465 [Pseudomonadota bacterium]